MLIFTRRAGEEIVIGSGENLIRVVVRKDAGDRVKLVIDAPKEMTIRRGELDTTNKEGDS